jgi:hypothetical protein
MWCGVCVCCDLHVSCAIRRYIRLRAHGELRPRTIDVALDAMATGASIVGGSALFGRARAGEYVIRVVSECVGDDGRCRHVARAATSAVVLPMRQSARSDCDSCTSTMPCSPSTRPCVRQSSSTECCSENLRSLSHELWSNCCWSTRFVVRCLHHYSFERVVGSGKTSYCNGFAQMFKALKRCILHRNCANASTQPSGAGHML